MVKATQGGTACGVRRKTTVEAGMDGLHGRRLRMPGGTPALLNGNGHSPGVGRVAKRCTLRDLGV